MLQYALTTSYLSAMLGFGFVVWAYGGVQTSVNGTLTTDIGYLLELPVLWFGVVLYVILAPVTFFQTLGTAHGPMKKAKSKDLEELSVQFNQDRRLFHAEIRKEDEIKKEVDLDLRFKRLDSVHKLYRMTEAFPVWPFDTGSIRTFGTVVISPIIIAV